MDLLEVEEWRPAGYLCFMSFKFEISPKSSFSLKSLQLVLLKMRSYSGEMGIGICSPTRATWISSGMVPSWDKPRSERAAVSLIRLKVLFWAAWWVVAWMTMGVSLGLITGCIPSLKCLHIPLKSTFVFARLVLPRRMSLMDESESVVFSMFVGL